MTAVRAAALQLGMPAPVADARLFRACFDLARVVPEEGIIAYPLVEFALQSNGIIEPSPHLLVVWGYLGNTEGIIDSLRPKVAEILGAEAPTRVGIGAMKRKSDGTGAVVFALQQSSVRTTPIPRSVPAGGSFAFDIMIDDPGQARVVVMRPDGVVEKIAPHPTTPGTVNARIECGTTIGAMKIEIGASGSAVLANFPVWCGVEPPRSMKVEPPRDDIPRNPVEAERQIFDLVNRERAAAGLAPLRRDDALTRVARAHSQEMLRTRTVEQELPNSSIRERVHAIRPAAVATHNVARAYGIMEAHRGLMGLPGAGAPLMSPAATHLAIGIFYGEEVSGRSELWITQVIAQLPFD